MPCVSGLASVGYTSRDLNPTEMDTLHAYVCTYIVIDYWQTTSCTSAIICIRTYNHISISCVCSVVVCLLLLIVWLVYRG